MKVIPPADPPGTFLHPPDAPLSPRADPRAPPILHSFCTHSAPSGLCTLHTFCVPDSPLSACAGLAWDRTRTLRGWGGPYTTPDSLVPMHSFCTECPSVALCLTCPGCCRLQATGRHAHAQCFAAVFKQAAQMGGRPGDLKAGWGELGKRATCMSTCRECPCTGSSAAHGRAM